ncbi:hypothetical protein [Acrocarpospora sp. B8E8]|uniref:hypothetical protein n=1 Tax=Acrocarpospora sp. B8E8 TaxID=3153572 RepID=UPI00325DC56B
MTTLPWDQAELDLSPDELAAIFAIKGWTYGTAQCAGTPSAADLKTYITDMAELLARTGRADVYATGGRFKVYKDPELPGSYEIYLYVGHVPDPHVRTDEEDGTL